MKLCSHSGVPAPVLWNPIGGMPTRRACLRGFFNGLHALMILRMHVEGHVRMRANFTHATALLAWNTQWITADLRRTSCGVSCTRRRGIELMNEVQQGSNTLRGTYAVADRRLVQRLECHRLVSQRSPAYVTFRVATYQHRLNLDFDLVWSVFSAPLAALAPFCGFLLPFQLVCGCCWPVNGRDNSMPSPLFLVIDLGAGRTRAGGSHVGTTMCVEQRARCLPFSQVLAELRCASRAAALRCTAAA